MILLACLILFGLFVLLMPTRVFRTAWANCSRRDGSWSRRRARSEAKHVTDFLGSVLFVLAAVVTATGTVVIVIHSYIVPIPIIVDILGAYDPDPVAWEANIEKGELGDVGARYENWGADHGLSDQSLRFWQEYLWQHWLALLIIGFIVGTCFYWLFAKFYVRAAVKYGQGVLKRKRAYAEWDAHHRSADRSATVSSSRVREA